MRSALPPLSVFLSLSLLGALCLFSLPARADLGPKPSIGKQTFHATYDVRIGSNTLSVKEQK